MALETLVRLCTRDDNLDLILATRPFKRQQKIVKLLFENVQQVNYFPDIKAKFREISKFSFSIIKMINRVSSWIFTNSPYI